MIWDCTKHCSTIWSSGPRSGVEVDFHSVNVEGERLPPAIETALYRIVQEGLTNVLKHAKARRVSLILQRSAQEQGGRSCAFQFSPFGFHGIALVRCFGTAQLRFPAVRVKEALLHAGTFPAVEV